MAQNPNIDDDTRARAMKFVANRTAPAKQRIVSKKELEDSGLSLRDFLNKERGLTRRKDADSATNTTSEAKDTAPEGAYRGLRSDTGDVSSSPPNPSRTPGGSAKRSSDSPAPVEKTGSNRVPTSEQAAENRQALMDKVKAVGSSVADYVENFETPAERSSRERKETSGMKHGGAVKKMASGGSVSSASKRADGIATKGKTRGRMC
jgi:hypothetical protein